MSSYYSKIPVYKKRGPNYHFLLSNHSQLFSVHEFTHHMQDVDFECEGAHPIKGIMTITQLGGDRTTVAYGFKGRKEDLQQDLPSILMQHEMKEESSYLISLTPGPNEFQLLSFKESSLRFKWYMENIASLEQVSSDDIIRVSKESDNQF